MDELSFQTGTPTHHSNRVCNGVLIAAIMRRGQQIDLAIVLLLWRET